MIKIKTRQEINIIHNCSITIRDLLETYFAGTAPEVPIYSPLTSIELYEHNTPLELNDKIKIMWSKKKVIENA